MIGWEKDKRWSDQFMDEIKSILGIHLIGEPPVEEDQERNTDLIVLKMDSVRIACRVRRNEYAVRYGEEFTVRAGRPSGIKTELTKIIEGWGDYFFYGFGDESKLSKWTLADLNVFRLWYNQQLFLGNHPGIKQNNDDGSSYFFAFRWDELPCNFIIAKSSVCCEDSIHG